MERKLDKRSEPQYEVLWPLARKAQRAQSTATAVGDLSGKTVAELWDYIFRGEIIYPAIRERLRERYPGIKFVDYTHFGNIHGPKQRDSIAVNGVMAGCRPEYMPVLVAVVEAIAKPNFRLEDAGSTPSWEPLIILSGPIIKELDFNHGAGLMKIGRQANGSIGRFLRLYLRNICGYRIAPGDGDKGSIGYSLTSCSRRTKSGRATSDGARSARTWAMRGARTR
jgi:hypothetical protein